MCESWVGDGQEMGGRVAQVAQGGGQVGSDSWGGEWQVMGGGKSWWGGGW